MSRRQQQELSNHSVTERPDKLGCVLKEQRDLKIFSKQLLVNSPTKQLKQSIPLGGEGLRTGGADQSILSLHFFGDVTNFLIQVSQHSEK